MDEGMTVGLEQELIADLTTELEIADENFNPTLLRSKVQNALIEVKAKRGYPSYYSNAQIENDMYNYYSNIRNIAQYDYNKIGAEGEQSHAENSTSRNYVDRNSFFAGIIKLSRTT